MSSLRMMFASGTSTPSGLKTPRTHGAHAEETPFLGADVEQGRTGYGTPRTRGESHVVLEVHHCATSGWRFAIVLVRVQAGASEVVRAKTFRARRKSEGGRFKLRVFFWVTAEDYNLWFSALQTMTTTCSIELNLSVVMQEAGKCPVCSDSRFGVFRSDEAREADIVTIFQTTNQRVIAGEHQTGRK